MHIENLSSTLGPNICLSGGADGADLQWGMCAGKMGHTVFHWSFAGHSSNAPDSEIVVLPSHELASDKVIRAVKETSKVVQKQVPKNEYAKKLIARNYFQVMYSDSVYAVSTIQNGIVQGGTGWAVHMYILKSGENCFVFDQAVDKWFKYESGWVEIDSPPSPSGIWAGIGSRELTKSGKDAIRKLTGYVKN